MGAMGVVPNKTIGTLRILRLLKLSKVAAKIPKLRVIFDGLAVGIGQIANISILMGLVVYMYSVLGVLLFRENDPWRFVHVGSALQTLVTVATGDWLNVFYTNYYGCDQFDGGVYVSPDTVANLASSDMHYSVCETPNPLPISTSLFFLAYITSTSLVNQECCFRLVL
jgi:hypothetical protein